MAQEIETMNDHLIGVQGGLITVMIPPTRMAKEEALRFAAWLVAIADDSPNHEQFNAVLAAVEMT